MSCKGCCLGLISSSFEGEQLQAVELNTPADPAQHDNMNYHSLPQVSFHLPARMCCHQAGVSSPLSRSTSSTLVWKSMQESVHWITIWVE